MRAVVVGLALILAGLAVVSQPSYAQAPAPAPQLFMSAADVSALVAKAKSDRKPDQANFVQPIVRLAPFTANLEYRVAGINANAAVHFRDAELFYVVEGSGTLVTGGKLRDERKTNADNLTGSGIEGGTRRRLAKGDYVIVPESTPHWFGEIEGALVMMSLHLPRSAAAAGGK
jgi:mannose-6-phosphate isomerase-like protein (cupin superfamily)